MPPLVKALGFVPRKVYPRPCLQSLKFPIVSQHKQLDLSPLTSSHLFFALSQLLDVRSLQKITWKSFEITSWYQMDSIASDSWHPLPTMRLRRREDCFRLLLPGEEISNSLQLVTTGKVHYHLTIYNYLILPTSTYLSLHGPNGS